jgi:hypothetical protein
LVSSCREFEVFLAGLGCLLLEGVQDVDRLIELDDLDHPPLAQSVDPDLVGSRSDVGQGLEV